MSKYLDLVMAKNAAYKKWQEAHEAWIAAHELEVIAQKEWNDACEKLAEHVTTSDPREEVT